MAVSSHERCYRFWRSSAAPEKLRRPTRSRSPEQAPGSPSSTPRSAHGAPPPNRATRSGGPCQVSIASPAAAPGVLDGDRRTARDRGVGVASFVHYPARFVANRKPAQLTVTRSTLVERAHPTLLSTGCQRTAQPPVRHRRLRWPLRRRGLALASASPARDERPLVRSANRPRGQLSVPLRVIGRRHVHLVVGVLAPWARLWGCAVVRIA